MLSRTTAEADTKEHRSQIHGRPSESDDGLVGGIQVGQSWQSVRQTRWTSACKELVPDLANCVGKHDYVIYHSPMLVGRC